jgi:UDP-N-acetylglucosamine 2-epimerase (non-hydrolysing)
MLNQVLSLFNIRPQIDLSLMEANQSLASLTSRAISAVAHRLAQLAPHLVLVQGDTTTAMVAGLASFYGRIPVGHVEAGLRTKDRYNPFPEEINRRLISVLATYHFAPTYTAVNALLAEGFPRENIYLTGNTVIDALQIVVKQNHQLDLGFSLNSSKLILVTAHRRENFGQPLRNICAALLEIARRNADLEIVYPVHLNPNVQDTVYPILSDRDRIHLMPPLNYGKFCYLMNLSYIVLTDSGGIQEEAPALGKPVLVMRNNTERPEAVEAGTVKIVGTEVESIVGQTEILLNDHTEYARMSSAVSPYGDGHAAERIVRVILEKMERKK